MSSINITPETTAVPVTGANQGIGFEIVKKLVAEQKDYHLILSGRRPDASIAVAAESIDETFGRLDVLINNSAISGMGIDDSPRARMQAVFNTNVIGTALVTDALLPLLARSTQTRRIVFVSSSLGSLTLKADPTFPFHKNDFGVYTHSKAALNMLALHYATTYEHDPQWKINMVCPGHLCGTNLNGYVTETPPSLGAISACRVATLGPDGKTGTYTNDKDENLPW